jgi:hypothetical protein
MVLPDGEGPIDLSHHGVHDLESKRALLSGSFSGIPLSVVPDRELRGSGFVVAQGDGDPSAGPFGKGCLMLFVISSVVMSPRGTAVSMETESGSISDFSSIVSSSTKESLIWASRESIYVPMSIRERFSDW